MVELYRDAGLDIYEKVHYSHGEHIREVDQILSWYLPRGTRILDIGCSGGLHALEFARRGFSVTGVDVEPSAIERAEERSRSQLLRAAFHALDIGRDDLASLGTFDLIYSLGNVISHIDKNRFGDVLERIRKRLDQDGIFLFDVLIKGNPFLEEIREEEHRIFWKRKLDEETDLIRMDGFFEEFDVTCPFEVWGYSVEEVCSIVCQSGFRHVDYSDRLDFSPSGISTTNPFCINFRAYMKEGV